MKTNLFQDGKLSSIMERIPIFHDYTQILNLNFWLRGKQENEHEDKKDFKNSLIIKQYYRKFLLSNFENGLFHLSSSRVMLRMEESSMINSFYTTTPYHLIILINGEGIDKVRK